MQQIFYNAKVHTQNNSQPEAEAFFVNDGKIVLVGSNDEILQMKQDETFVVDLEQKDIYPTFFDVNSNIYQMIEENLKNANLEGFLENNEEFDENYENFCNYEQYKQEFLKIQNEYISNGITTVQEIDVSAKEFIFWKKISEEKLLKIDVIAYINIITNKDVMDNNCRSYRKYKNHFRIGGYYVKLDGDILSSTAWLSKKYKGTQNYKGYAQIFDEQLSYIIKTSFEEKKQLFVEANGDESITQFLRVFEEVFDAEKPEELFRIILHSPQQLSKKHLEKIKKFDITPSINFGKISNNFKAYKNLIGGSRARKTLPGKMLYNNNIDYVSHTDLNKNISVSNRLKSMIETKFAKLKKLAVEDLISKDLKVSSHIAFDNELKASFEAGKFANFVVLKKDSDILNFEIEDVYLEGEKAN